MDEAKKRELVEMAVENQSSHGEGTERNRFRYNYATNKLLNEYFDFHEMETYARDLQLDLMAILQDIGAEKAGYDDWEFHYPVDVTISDNGLLEVFSRKMNKIKADVMSADSMSVTFYFPLNILHEGEQPEFEEYGVRFHQMSTEEWEKQIDLFGSHPDTTGTYYISNLTEENEFSYWRASVNSKGHNYALYKASTAIKLICSKLNFSKYHNEMQHLSDREGMLSRPESGTPRWSRIRGPFAYLWSDENGPRDCIISDRSGREPVKIDWTEEEFKSKFQSLPSFDWQSTGTSKLIHDAFLEYQDALTATERVDAFFRFWIGLENLTQSGRGNKKEVVDRALFAYQVVSGDDYDSIIEDIKGELWDTRNNLVHSSNWERIWTYQEKVVKLLLDGLIEFYLEEAIGLDKPLIKTIFQFSKIDDDIIERRIQALETVQQMKEI